MIVKRSRIKDKAGLRRCLAYILIAKQGNKERLACAPLIHGIPFAIPDVNDKSAVIKWAKNTANYLWTKMENQRMNMGREMPRWKAIHVSFSLHPKETVKPEKLLEIAGEGVAIAMPGQRNFLGGVHCDEAHSHAHYLVMTMDERGMVWNPKMDYRVWEDVAEQLESKYELFRVQSRKSCGRAPEKRGISCKEMNMALRTGQLSQKMKTQGILDAVIGDPHVHDIAWFCLELEKQGIRPVFNVSKTTGLVTGVSYVDGDTPIKGSALGKKYAWSSIKARFKHPGSTDQIIEQRKQTKQESIKENNDNEKGTTQRLENQVAKSSEYAIRRAVRRPIAAAINSIAKSCDLGAQLLR